MVANIATRPHYISYELGALPSKAVEFWRGRGLPALTWTMKSQDDLATARAYADNHIFENIRP